LAQYRVYKGARFEIRYAKCPENCRPTPFESASAVKYLRLPTALRSKPRIPNAMFLEIERAARYELISIADFVRTALLEKLKRERDKNET
jgi:hypothetical protein